MPSWNKNLVKRRITDLADMAAIASQSGCCCPSVHLFQARRMYCSIPLEATGKETNRGHVGGSVSVITLQWTRRLMAHCKAADKAPPLCPFMHSVARFNAGIHIFLADWSLVAVLFFLALRCNFACSYATHRSWVGPFSSPLAVLGQLVSRKRGSEYANFQICPALSPPVDF